MPELPEVETVVRALQPALTGKTFAHVEQRRPDLRFALPDRFASRLTGARVTHVRRRAKFALADLSTGETLLLHLGMSGRVLIAAPNTLAQPLEMSGTLAPTAVLHQDRRTVSVATVSAALSDNEHSAEPVPHAGHLPQHDHVIFTLDDGTRVVFNDHRRFGYMDLLATHTAEQSAHLQRLGPEPLGNCFHAAYLDGALAGRKSAIKAALLDQRIIAGLGNIYVCEALHRAGVSPRRISGTIPGKRSARLVVAIRDVLTRAIAAGGSSLRDYVGADGALGYFQHTFDVYDRQDQPCRRTGCTGTVQRLVQSNRSTFFCSSCQR